MDHDFTQQRQSWLELVPDPYRQSFAGRIFEALDLVEIMVIKAVVHGLESGLDIGEVHYPAGLSIDVAADVQLDTEGMTVQARAFVSGRNIGQPVRRFEGEDFENVHRWALRIGLCRTQGLAVRCVRAWTVRWWYGCYRTGGVSQ